MRDDSSAINVFLHAPNSNQNWNWYTFIHDTCELVNVEYFLRPPAMFWTMLTRRSWILLANFAKAIIFRLHTVTKDDLFSTFVLLTNRDHRPAMFWTMFLRRIGLLANFAQANISRLNCLEGRFIFNVCAVCCSRCNCHRSWNI